MRVWILHDSSRAISSNWLKFTKSYFSTVDHTSTHYFLISLAYVSAVQRLPSPSIILAFATFFHFFKVDIQFVPPSFNLYNKVNYLKEKSTQLNTSYPFNIESINTSLAKNTKIKRISKQYQLSNEGTYRRDCKNNAQTAVLNTPRHLPWIRIYLCLTSFNILFPNEQFYRLCYFHPMNTNPRTNDCDVHTKIFPLPNLDIL